MSYDVSLRMGPQVPCPTCGHSALEGGKEVFSRNHTSNTAQMWRDAGCDLAEFHGKLASELEAPLRTAFLRIEGSQEEFRKHEPDNGWGTLESTLAFLQAIYDACLAYPNAVVDVCH